MYWVNGLYVNTVSGRNYFQSANPGGGIPKGTQVTTAWLADVQAENLHWLDTAGIAPAPATPTQVLQSAMRIFGGNRTVISANAMLTPDNAGTVLVNAAAGNITITMPAVNSAGSLPLRYRFVRTDASTNTVTVQDAGSDTDAPGAVTSVLVPTQKTVELLGDGVSVWQVLSGSYVSTAELSAILGSYLAGGNHASSIGSPASISTSVTFTPTRNATLMVIGMGANAAGVASLVFSGSGYTTVFGDGEWLSGSAPAMGLYVGTITVTAGVSVTLTMELTPTTPASPMGVDLIFYGVPNQ